MNKILFYTLLILINIIFISCSDNWEPGKFPSTSFADESSMQRTFDEALQIAQDAINELEKNTTTRSTFNSRKICIDSTQIVCNNHLTRSEHNINIDTLMFIFNFEDSLGFAVVSGNKATPGLISIAEYGHYNPSEKQKNKSFSMMMERAKIYVMTRFGGRPPIMNDSTLLPFYIFNPKIPVRWGQEAYYGMEYNNGLAGCGPVAIAQTLAYFEAPDTLPLTYIGYSNHPDTLYLNWTEIKKHKIYHDVSIIDSTKCTAINPTQVHNDISYLMRQIGELTEKNDSNFNYTLIKTEKIPYCLNIMGLQCTSFYAYFSGCTINPLINDHIILVTGKAEGAGYGHAFLVDSYLQRYSRPANTPTIITTTYNHVNWGWDGINDGYYLDELFDLGNPYQLDGYGTTNETTVYSEDLNYIEIWK